MGCYDSVIIPCPKCGLLHAAQSKGGDSLLRTFTLEDCPIDVLCDINRHAPFQCALCGTHFEVKYELSPPTVTMARTTAVGEDSDVVLIIHQTVTNGPVVIRQVKREKIGEYTAEHSLTDQDYAIIRGHMIKDFDGSLPIEPKEEG